MLLSDLAIVWCVVSLLAAGLVKGVTGIGLPLVSIPLLTLVVPVPFAVALLPVPMLVTNVWQSLRSGFLLYAVRRFWPLLLAMSAATFFGANLLVAVDVALLDGIVGAVVVVFSITVIRQPRLLLPRRIEPWTGAVAGALGGTLGGITALFGPPILIFLASIGLDRERFVGCITTIYLCAGLAMLTSLAGVGVMQRDELVSSSLATLPLFAGMLAGERLRRRLDEGLFRRIMVLVLMLAGVRLLWRAFSAVVSGY